MALEDVFMLRVVWNEFIIGRRVYKDFPTEEQIEEAIKYYNGNGAYVERKYRLEQEG